MALNKLFTYAVPAEFKEKLTIGQLLSVPFAHRTVRGFALRVWEDDEIVDNSTSRNYEITKLQNVNKPKITIKPIISIVDEVPFFSSNVLELVKWIASYTDSPIESALRAAVPAAVMKPSAKPKELLYVEAVTPPSPPKLTKYQVELLADIKRVDGGWLSQITKELKTTAATLRVLEKKGVVKIVSRVSRRDPLAGRKVMPTKPLELNEMQSAALAVICGSGEAWSRLLRHVVPRNDKHVITSEAK